KGIVTETVKPHIKGRVKIGGEEWAAQVASDVILQKGTVVYVTRVEGNKVIVK
ncbi:unnamed protein product, partial [marine sediment metagenome]